MQPQTFTTTRTARYYCLGEPGPTIRHVWFCLHGEGQSAADFAAQLSNLDTPERLLIFPEALSRYSLPPSPDGMVSTGATWFAPPDLLLDLADLTTYLDALAESILEACPPDTPVTVLGYGHGAAAACRWLAGNRIAYDRLILYAAIFPPEIDRRATLVALPDRPVSVVATTVDIITPEAAAAGLMQDLQDVGLTAQLSYVAEDGLTLAALGAGAETVNYDPTPNPTE
ncbi:alpha/beta hydrolase [Hymenobacter sp. HD11105]